MSKLSPDKTTQLSFCDQMYEEAQFRTTNQ